ncbi:hypothetical protein D9757_011745 [Collybiopsis confluens]|uniref:Uncharacterized protein n=1 Tax=Collybiopsis confluens TaxID=2823264 RepID=A0A8H5LK41_9AGAR|nr:hypothetical protein D9757_011745 [Collybiopsis confluens]
MAAQHCIDVSDLNAAQYSGEVSTLMIQNAKDVGEAKLDFEIWQFQRLATSAEVAAGLRFVRNSLGPMLAVLVPSEPHRKICMQNATSALLLRQMFPYHRVLLALISLRHNILRHKNFDILRAWKPILCGLDKIRRPLLYVPSSALISAMATTKVPFEESASHVNSGLLTNPRQVPAMLASQTNIGPPPSLPLPPLPAGRVCKPGIASRPPIPLGSYSTPIRPDADTEHILDLSPFGKQPAKNLEADSKLNQIKAQHCSPSDMSFSEAEVEESLLHDQELSSDSDAIDPSLLVSWSDLGGYPQPHEVFSPARSPSPAVHSSDFVEAYLLLGQQTWPNYQFAASESDSLPAALPSSTVSAPFLPGAWKLKAPKTPARRSSAYISSSSALRLKRAAEDLPPSSPPIQSSSAPRPKRVAEHQLSSPASTTSFYTARSDLDDASVLRPRKIKQAAYRAPISVRWRILEPPCPVQAGINKIRRKHSSSRAAVHGNLDA